MSTYRAARLHGVGDLRIDQLDVPVPATGEVLVRVEACGICPTDVRKFHVGVNEGHYPLNPGHEWIGRVAACGPGVTRLEVGQRVYGDTYGGYGEYAVLAQDPDGWSYGALPIPDDMPPHRAVFVEPLADCLHAVLDQGGVREGARVLVVGAGQMGIQMVAVAAEFGGVTSASDPVAHRRELAAAAGAIQTLDPTSAALAEQVGPAAFDVVILTLGRASLVPELLPMLDVGGRLVLFAGFGPDGVVAVDLNDIHYRELSIIGSEWVGTPPVQRFERYPQALDLLRRGGRFGFESLVTGTCDLDGITGAFDELSGLRHTKIVVNLEGAHV